METWILVDSFIKIIKEGSSEGAKTCTVKEERQYLRISSKAPLEQEQGKQQNKTT